MRGTGGKLWKFDPESGNYRPEIFRFSGSLGGHRGVAYWQGKIYVAAIDGRLFALDAKNGKVVWVVQTLDDPKGHKTISGSPRVFRDMAIIGQTGDLGSRGYVTAYDARTGVQRWRFYTVPGDPTLGFENEAMAAAAKTWTGQWWKSGGNASVWMASPTTRNSVAFILALLTGFRSRAPAPGCPREIICSCPRSSRWMRIQGSIFGTIRKLGGQLRLRLEHVDGARGSHHCRNRAQGATARPQEWILLRHRPSHGQTDFSGKILRGHVG